MDINSQNTGLTLHKDLTTLNTTLNTTITLMDINNQNTGLTLHKDLTTLNTTITLLDINNQSTGLTLHKDLTTLNSTITLMDINNQSMGLTLHTDLTTLNSNITLMDINSQNTGLTLHKALTTLNSNITLMDINNQSTGLTLHKALTGINTAITLMDINNQSMGLTLHKALTALDKKMTQQYNTTNLDGITGVNIYEILPKRKYFRFNATTANTLANAQIGSVGNTQLFFYNNYGSSNPKTWYASMSSTGQTGVLIYTYVDDTKTEGTSSVTLAATGSWYPLRSIGGVTGTIISINDWSYNKSFRPTTDTLYISPGVTSILQSVSGGNLLNNCNSIFTCPNTAIAWVNSVSFFSQAADTLRLFKWDNSGIRSVLYTFPSSTSFNMTAPDYGFGGYISAGESIGWGGETGSTFKSVSSNVTVHYL